MNHKNSIVFQKARFCAWNVGVSQLFNFMINSILSAFKQFVCCSVTFSSHFLSGRCSADRFNFLTSNGHREEHSWRSFCRCVWISCGWGCWKGGGWSVVLLLRTPANSPLIRAIIVLDQLALFVRSTFQKRPIKFVWKVWEAPGSSLKSLVSLISSIPITALSFLRGIPQILWDEKKFKMALERFEFWTRHFCNGVTGVYQTPCFG